MKLLTKIFFIVNLFFLLPANGEEHCLDINNINYDLSFLKENSFLDKDSIINDFKNGVKCYRAPDYNKTGVVETEYYINSNKNKYKNSIYLGEQAFFFNNKIPKNSILYSHPTFPILLFQEQFLDKDDIGDYYLSFEKTESIREKDTTKTTYYSPYDFFKLSIQFVPSFSSDTIIYEFNSKNDINLLKEKIENYFLSTVKNNSLPMKLENKENIEVLRVYVHDYLNSLTVMEPFIKIFLDHIDYNHLNFSNNTKMEIIDEVYSNEKEINPFTIFGKDLLISYTFDKENNKGLIAFSFLKDANTIKYIQEEFNFED